MLAGGGGTIVPAEKAVHRRLGLYGEALGVNKLHAVRWPFSWAVQMATAMHSEVASEDYAVEDTGGGGYEVHPAYGSLPANLAPSRSALPSPAQ